MSPTPMVSTDGLIASNRPITTGREEVQTEIQNRGPRHHHHHLCRCALSPPTTSSLRRLALPSRCLKLDHIRLRGRQGQASPPFLLATLLYLRPLSSSLINDDRCLDRPRTKEGWPKGYTELCEDLRLWLSERAPAGEERKAKTTIRTQDEGRGDRLGSRTSPKRNGVAAGPIPPSRRNKIGTNLMDLLYETKEDKIVNVRCIAQASDTVCRQLY